MAEILITHSYFLRFDPKQWKAGKPYPPLASLYAASVLREAGYDVAFHDTMFSVSPDEIQTPIQKFSPRILVIYDDGFNYLTKMCLTNMREAAFRMASLAAKYDCKVIISGSDATDHSAQYLQHGVDYVMVGEGEQTLLETVNAIMKQTGKIDAVNGLRYLENGEVKHNPPRTNQADLDAFPFPAWDLVNMESYRDMWMDHAGYFSLNIGTTRGCPFKCNWCAKPIYGNRYNSRSPENVVAELKMLKVRYAFDHIWFCDDIFGLKPGWVKKFADLVEKENLKFRFKIQSRADLLLEDDHIAALARAGCEEVWMGAESGSQKVLDAMDKGTKVEQIAEATKLMRRHKIKPCFFLQFGYPGETHDDIRLTLDMVFSLMPHDIGISVSYPLPGTRFYEKVKAELRGKTNWTDSDELAVMYRSTYPPRFYKKLQRYVHYEFRKRNALLALKRLVKSPVTAGYPDVKKALSYSYRWPHTFVFRAFIYRYAGGN